MVRFLERVNCDQTVSRVSRGPLRGDGLRPPVLTDSLLTRGTRPGYDALSRCAELARALAWGEGGSCFVAGRRIEPSALMVVWRATVRLRGGFIAATGINPPRF